MKLWYDPSGVAPGLRRAFSVLEERVPLFSSPREGATEVEFQPIAADGSLTIKGDGEVVRVGYHHVTQACRAVGLLLGLDKPPAEDVDERAGFETMGLMIDCSRNAVMRVEYLQEWLCYMALSGYNMLMLYTEDTYCIPGEPLFGYLRGAYTLDEIRQVDAYAASLGIELIPCIQTLGHLEQILKWRHTYADVRDTASVLLAEEPKTYELISSMISFWAEAVTSRRIHIGMDETHDLGRGRYLDRFGYRRGFDIFNRHLAEVVGICNAQGLRPMVWSDMYFRMGSKTGDYYDLESQVPAQVAAAIPHEAQLVYWDYYHTTDSFYREWIRRHREMGFEPVMGSGIWTWGRLVHSHAFTTQTMLPCVRACLEEGLREIFFTMWKDDGGGVDLSTALPGVVQAAEAAYNQGRVNEALWEARFRGTCGGKLAAQLEASELDPCTRYEDGEVNSRMLLWDDPLLGLYRRSLLARPEFHDFEPAEYYGQLADGLAALAGPAESAGPRRGEDLDFARQLARTLALKTGLSDRLRDAYQRRDPDALSDLVQAQIPQVVAAVKRLWVLHRRVWMNQNKAFGFEVMCVRYGGLLWRLEEVETRVKELLAGEIERIEELDEPFEPLPERLSRYRSVATSSSIL